MNGKKKIFFIYVEGVTLVLPSRLSCLTNIRENISYKLEYQLCETRSIRTSTSITLKETKGQPFSPFTSTKKSLDAHPQFTFISQSASVWWALHTHTRNFHRRSRNLACLESSEKLRPFGGTQGHTPKALKPRSASVGPCGPCCLSNTPRDVVPLGWL